MEILFPADIVLIHIMYYRVTASTPSCYRDLYQGVNVFLYFRANTPYSYRELYQGVKIYFCIPELTHHPATENYIKM